MREINSAICDKAEYISRLIEIFTRAGHSLYLPEGTVDPISLGRPEIFEKVAKIGVGVHIWLLKVSELTHH